MTCKHAASGCNAPESDCIGLCQPRPVANPCGSLAQSMERRLKGKTVKEIWNNAGGLEIVFDDESSLIIGPPYVFNPTHTAHEGS